MEKFALNVQERKVVGHKVSGLRRQGVVPGVLYGGDEPSVNLQFELRELEKLLSQGGAMRLIDLLGDNLPATRVLLRDVQRHPTRRTIEHVDFIRVTKGAKFRTSVPLVIVGTAPVESDGAIVLQNANTIEVECLPDDLPAQIEIDVSGLNSIHQNISGADLPLPPGVELASEHDAEFVVVSVTMPRRGMEAAEEEEALEGIELGEPELVGRHREESDEEED